MDDHPVCYGPFALCAFLLSLANRTRILLGEIYYIVMLNNDHSLVV